MHVFFVFLFFNIVSACTIDVLSFKDNVNFGKVKYVFSNTYDSISWSHTQMNVYDAQGIFVGSEQCSNFLHCNYITENCEQYYADVVKKSVGNNSEYQICIYNKNGAHASDILYKDGLVYHFGNKCSPCIFSNAFKYSGACVHPCAILNRILCVDNTNNTNVSDLSDLFDQQLLLH